MPTDPASELLAAVQNIATALPSPVELAGDFAICGDVHVPYTDWSMALRVAAVARKELKRPRRLIVAGDFWNMDAYSHYPPIAPAPGWQEEKRAGKALANAWAATFEEIYFLMGNHERRKTKFVAAQEDDTDIFAPLASVARIQSTSYGWAYVHSGGIKWLVCHPREYSINQLVIADQLAQKYQCNVMDFHQHHTAKGRDRFDRYDIVDCGCLQDYDRTPYTQYDVSKRPRFKESFSILRGGIASLFGDGWVDWGKYG